MGLSQNWLLPQERVGEGGGGGAGGAALVSVGNNEMTQGGLQIQPQTPDPRCFLP